MGMYSTHKEIPSAVLAKLLEKPMDEAHVDEILFDREGGWRPELCVTTSPGAFTCAHLPLGEDDQRVLGELDCGKHGVDTVPFAWYLAQSGTPERGAALAELLDVMTIGRSLDEIADRP